MQFAQNKKSKFHPQITQVSQGVRYKFLAFLFGGLWLTTIVLCVYLAFRTPPTNNPYPLLDFSRSFLDQKHFFTTLQPLRNSLNELVKSYSANGDRVGIYFEYLNTGANIGIAEKDRFWPASLSKMPTLIAVMKKVERGEWKLSDELVLFSDDKDDRYGELYKRTVGTRFTIEELLKETIINSDNTAHKILVRNLASEDYTDIFEALGITELFDQNYDISPKEYSVLMRSLYASSYLKREYSNMLLDWLTQTPFDYLLGAGIPDNVPFAHKIGEEYQQNVFLDAGIAYVEHRPYLLIVMAESPEGMPRAKEIMKQVSEAVYDYVDKTNR